MSLQVNPKIATTGFMSQRNTQKAYKLNYSIRVSCKANNFYEILSLGSKNGSVGIDEIKKAYRSMALQYHPDVCPSSTKEESTRRFVELREAYETLSNQVSRKSHDYELGFADSLGFDGQSLEKRRSRFPKQVWENQLYRLEKRSQIRTQKKAI